MSKPVRVINHVQTGAESSGTIIPTGKWETAFQQIKINTDEGLIDCYRFITIRPNGDLYHAGNGAALTPETISDLLDQAKKAGWYKPMRNLNLDLKMNVSEIDFNADNFTAKNAIDTIINAVNLHFSKLTGYYQKDQIEKAIIDANALRFTVLQATKHLKNLYNAGKDRIEKLNNLLDKSGIDCITDSD